MRVPSLLAHKRLVSPFNENTIGKSTVVVIQAFPYRSMAMERDKLSGDHPTIFSLERVIWGSNLSVLRWERGSLTPSVEQGSRIGCNLRCFRLLEVFYDKLDSITATQNQLQCISITGLNGSVLVGSSCTSGTKWSCASSLQAMAIGGPVTR